MRISERHKQQLEKAKKTKAQVEAISRLMDEGLGEKEIADSLDLSELQVRDLIEAYGIDWT